MLRDMSLDHKESPPDHMIKTGPLYMALNNSLSLASAISNIQTDVNLSEQKKCLRNSHTPGI